MINIKKNIKQHESQKWLIKDYYEVHWQGQVLYDWKPVGPTSVPLPLRKPVEKTYWELRIIESFP